MKLRVRPARVREILDHYETHGWSATMTTYSLHGRTFARWVRERAAQGPGWPTQAEDDQWVATLERRTYDAARLRTYRTRSLYGRRQLWLDATGTRRRIRALHRLGWRAVDIAELGPWGCRDAVLELAKRSKVTIRNADNIAAIYDQLSMKLGPSAQTRARAERAGWSPPLAWDDDTIDDPAAMPAGEYQPHAWSTPVAGGFLQLPPEPVDEVAVQRILDGDWRLRCTKADKFEVVARWTGSLNELEKLTGWKAHRYVTREDGVA